MAVVAADARHGQMSRSCRDPADGCFCPPGEPSRSSPAHERGCGLFFREGWLITPSAPARAQARLLGAAANAARRLSEVI